MISVFLGYFVFTKVESFFTSIRILERSTILIKRMPNKLISNFEIAAPMFIRSVQQTTMHEW